MKLNVTLSDIDNITLDFNGNAIGWIQRTNGSIEWAGQIANKVTTIFPKYKLVNFSFVTSPKGGYDVTAQWQRKD